VTPVLTAPLPWPYRLLATFITGVICGAAAIPAVHLVLYGQIDPFRHGWPLVLHATSFFSGLIIAAWFRYTPAVAPGVYVGLVSLMLMSGQAEYPIASAIGLFIHGFLPAAVGSIIAFVALKFYDASLKRR